MNDFPQDSGTGRSGWLFLTALRVAFGRAPLWLFSGGVILLLALADAQSWAAWVDGLGARYAPGAELHSLTQNFRQDQALDLERLRSGSAAALGVLSLFAMLVGAFVAGGWLQISLERTHGQSVRRFFFGGARYFMRFLRLLFLMLLVLALWHWVLYGLLWDELVLGQLLDVPEHDRATLETLDSELTVRRLGWAQDGSAALLFALTMIWAKYTRARIALHDTTSVIWAGWCTLFVLLWNPIRTLRPQALLFGLKAVVLVGALGFTSRWLDSQLATEPASWHVWSLAGCSVAAVLWSQLLRGASYHVAARVSQELVKPSLKADPWNVIGGPGGPQYPVDDAEDYQVSV